MSCTNCPDRHGRTCVERTARRWVVFIIVLTTFVVIAQVMTA